MRLGDFHLGFGNFSSVLRHHHGELLGHAGVRHHLMDLQRTCRGPRNRLMSVQRRNFKCIFLPRCTNESTQRPHFMVTVWCCFIWSRYSRMLTLSTSPAVSCAPKIWYWIEISLNRSRLKTAFPIYLQTHRTLQHARIAVRLVKVVDGEAQRRTAVVAASATIRQIHGYMRLVHVHGQQGAGVATNLNVSNQITISTICILEHTNHSSQQYSPHR